MLPCTTSQDTSRQIKAAMELLRNLHTLHPEILIEHGITPELYLDGLVFKSAVESIRGTFSASSQKGREAFVNSVLLAMKSRLMIEEFQHTSAVERCDFRVQITADYMAGIEVKGGEGNSIQISVRPDEAQEFAIWSHLDGSLQHPPSAGAHKVIGRILNQMRAEKKQVDVLFIRDRLCNTTFRPCPKYFKGEYAESPLGVAPDIFLFPSTVSSATNTFDSLRLPRLMLELFGVPESRWSDHIWEVRYGFANSPPDQLELLPAQAITDTVTIWHKGLQVDRFKSKGL